MSRRVVILEGGSDRTVAVASRLADRGMVVAVAATVDEARERVREGCAALVLDASDRDALGALLGWIQAQVRPLPVIVRLLAAADDFAGWGASRGITVPPDVDAADAAELVFEAVRWWPGDD